MCYASTAATVERHCEDKRTKLRRAVAPLDSRHRAGIDADDGQIAVDINTGELPVLLVAVREGHGDLVVPDVVGVCQHRPRRDDHARPVAPAATDAHS